MFWQRLVPVFFVLLFVGKGKCTCPSEVCLSLGSLLVPRTKIYSSESNFYLSRAIGQRFCRTVTQPLSNASFFQTSLQLLKPLANLWFFTSIRAKLQLVDVFWIIIPHASVPF